MRETASQELIDLILHGREERDLEYKRSVSWDEPNAKATITRSILGMVNLRGGGSIILGVEQQDDDFVLIGMRSNHARSFSQDEVAAYVNEHADPFVEIEVALVPYDGKEFIVIQVQEFAEIPVICRKEIFLDGKAHLRKGSIYTRSRRIYETVEVPSQTEMREIIELAIDKGIRRLIERMGRIGILRLIMEPSDAEKFDQQLEEMK